MKPLIVPHVIYHNPPDQKLIIRSLPPYSPVTPSKLRKFYKPPMLIIFGIPQKTLLQEIKRKKMTSNKEISTVKGIKIHYQENLQGKTWGREKNTKYIPKTTP
jgi:hypothetical protein